MKPISSSVSHLVEHVGALDARIVPQLAFECRFGVELVLDVVASSLGRTERWRVVGQGPCEFRLHANLGATPLVHTADHVVLKEHLEPRAELTFHGRYRMPTAVVGALHEAHVAYAHHWLPFGQWLNLDVLRCGFGRLACGPRSFVDAMAAALVPFEMKPSVLALNGPPPQRGISALLFGPNFVVGRDLMAKRIPLEPSMGGRAIERGGKRAA